LGKHSLIYFLSLSPANNKNAYRKDEKLKKCRAWSGQ